MDYGSHDVNLGHGMLEHKMCYLHNLPNSKLYLNTGYISNLYAEIIFCMIHTKKVVVNNSNFKRCISKKIYLHIRFVQSIILLHQIDEIAQESVAFNGNVNTFS
jgi:hypothetical protein